MSECLSSLRKLFRVCFASGSPFCWHPTSNLFLQDRSISRSISGSVHLLALPLSFPSLAAFFLPLVAVNSSINSSFTFSISDAMLNSLFVVHVRRRNIVGCAVQTNATLLDHASMTAKQYKCWHLFALKFDQFQTSSNNFQVATTHNNTQHGVQTLATCWAQQCCERLHGPLVVNRSEKKNPLAFES